MPLWPMLMGEIGGGGGPTGPIILDGTAEHGTANTASPATTALVTTLTDNLLIAAWSGSRGTSVVATVNTVTSTSGLVWTRIGEIDSSLDSGARHGRLSLWTAFAPVALGAEIVQFNLSSSVVCNCVAVAAFHGVVGSSGVYVLDGTVLSDADDSTHPSVTMTTTHANDLLVFSSMGVFPSSNNTEPTGFVRDSRQQLSFGLFTGTLGLSHKIPLATQSGLVLEVPGVGAGVGLCIAFALKGS